MFAVLHIADFPLQAVLRTEPDTAGRPAALFASGTKKSVVLAANAPARTLGVERGMTAPQAVARAPALLIRAPAPAADAEARATLLAIAFTLSPAIEDTAPGVCTVDLKGLDPAKRLPAARAAVAELGRSGLIATAGIGRTPLLALYAARTAVASEPATEPMVCETETPRASGDGDNVIEASDEKIFLSPLPIAAADPSPALAAIFATWGLRTLGELTALPRDEMIRRFGAEGLALWLRATGGQPRPLHPVALPQQFSAALEFEEPVETLEPLVFIIRRFLERLSLELRAAQFVATAIELKLQLEDENAYSRSFRLPEPTSDVEILFRALHTHLESLRTAAAITAFELRLVPARPLVRQQGLFETGLRDPHGFAETLARVSALVGADRVGTPQLEDTHRPDAVKLVPPPAVIPPPAPAPVHPALGLPLRRFRPPVPAQLEFTEGCPTYLWTERIRGPITALSRAFCSSGHGDPVWSRTDWDIALGDAGLYRLVLIKDTYFLEGEYD